ncbi:MAG: hypothetical protein KGQ59_03395 [Bdellovibrionales bacterium]|nr:hypothetical protein [Bdellovibrionales bacterium]
MKKSKRPVKLAVSRDRRTLEGMGAADIAKGMNWSILLKQALQVLLIHEFFPKDLEKRQSKRLKSFWRAAKDLSSVTFEQLRVRTARAICDELSKDLRANRRKLCESAEIRKKWIKDWDQRISSWNGPIGSASSFISMSGSIADIMTESEKREKLPRSQMAEDTDSETDLLNLMDSRRKISSGDIAAMLANHISGGGVTRGVRRSPESFEVGSATLDRELFVAISDRLFQFRPEAARRFYEKYIPNAVDGFLDLDSI